MSQVIASSLALPLPSKALISEPIIGETYAQVQAVLNRLFGRLVGSLGGWVAQGDGDDLTPWKTLSVTPTALNSNDGLHFYDVQGAPILKRKTGVLGDKRVCVLLAHLSGARLDVDLIPWSGAGALSLTVSQAPDSWAWVAHVVSFDESVTDDLSGPLPLQIDARGSRLGTEALVLQWHVFEAFLTSTAEMPI